jgi:hypothetical protein
MDYVWQFLHDLFLWIGLACILICLVAGELYLVRILDGGPVIGLVLSLGFGVVDVGVVISGAMLVVQ